MSDAIRLKVLPQFPAQLIGRAGIDVTKATGNYYLDLDYTTFPVIGAVPAGTTYALIYNPATGTYAQLPISLLGGGGGIPDAPSDGTLYGRRNLAWAAVPPAGIADAPNDGLSYIRRSLGWFASRELLTADRTYYVRLDGSDANNGLANSAGGAFRTIQRACTVVATLDMSIYQVTVQLGAGTFAEIVSLTRCFGSRFPAIVGDMTTPANVVISGNNDIFSAGAPGINWRIGGVKLTTTAGHGLRATLGSFIVAEKIDFGAIAGYHMSAEQYGTIQIGNSVFTYTISGNANAHINTISGGFIQTTQNAVTIIGTPAINAFVTTQILGLVRCDAMTFAGTCTGQKYSVNSNAVCFTAGGGINYLPGSTAGTQATGGQYL